MNKLSLKLETVGEESLIDLISKLSASFYISLAAFHFQSITWKYTWNQILYYDKTTAQTKYTLFCLITHWAKN